MFFKLGDLIEPTLEKLELSKKAKKYMAFYLWDEVVGEKISQYSQPAFFKGSKLFVNVKNSAWIQELSFLKSSIKEHLNQKIGENLIKDIFFINKPLKTWGGCESVSEDDFPDLEKLTLAPGQIKKIEEITRNISDLKLKETLKRIISKEVLLSEWKTKRKQKLYSKRRTLKKRKVM